MAEFGCPMRWFRGHSELLIHSDDGPADGALLTARLIHGHDVNTDTPLHTQNATEEDGTGELEVDFSECGNGRTGGFGPCHVWGIVRNAKVAHQAGVLKISLFGQNKMHLVINGERKETSIPWEPV